MHFGFNEAMWFVVLIVNFVIVLAVYRFMGKTGLFVWMAIASILANIQVLKLVDFFGWNITLGNVLYGTSFLATDIISENYSKELAHKSVWVGFFAMISMIILMTLSCLFIPAADDFVSEHMKAIFTGSSSKLKNFPNWKIARSLPIWIMMLFPDFDWKPVKS